MSGRSPAGPLMHEHRVIERMIKVMERELASIATHGRTDPARIDIVTDFIRTYADRCHHGKEEDILFRLLADKPLDGPLGVAMQGLIDDHAHARVLTGRLVEANGRYANGDEPALAEIESTIRELVEFYPVHIAKEDRKFFRPCLAFFTDDEQTEMLSAFEEFD